MKFKVGQTVEIKFTDSALDPDQYLITRIDGIYKSRDEHSILLAPVSISLTYKDGDYQPLGNMYFSLRLARLVGRECDNFDGGGYEFVAEIFIQD
jgi:hypothetical protein